MGLPSPTQAPNHTALFPPFQAEVSVSLPRIVLSLCDNAGMDLVTAVFEDVNLSVLQHPYDTAIAFTNQAWVVRDGFTPGTAYPQARPVCRGTSVGSVVDDGGVFFVTSTPTASSPRPCGRLCRTRRRVVPARPSCRLR